MLSHSFTVILIPLLIALFYFSSPKMRLKPIFIVNIVNLALGFTNGMTLDYRNVRILTIFESYVSFETRLTPSYRP